MSIYGSDVHIPRGGPSPVLVGLVTFGVCMLFGWVGIPLLEVLA